MGLFGKQSKPRDKVHVIDLGSNVVSSPKLNVAGVPTGHSGTAPNAERLRPNLARLFEDDNSSSKSQVASPVEADTEHIRPYLSKLFASSDALPDPSLKLLSDTIDNPASRMEQSTLISQSETVGDLFLKKTISSFYPDAGKPSQPSGDILKWSIPSPSKASTRSLKSPISPARRQQLMNRTNSLSRLVKRASSFKRSTSTRSLKGQNEVEAQTATEVNSRTAESQQNEVSPFLSFKSPTSCSSSQREEMISNFALDEVRISKTNLSVSPTTPHVEKASLRATPTSGASLQNMMSTALTLDSDNIASIPLNRRAGSIPWMTAQVPETLATPTSYEPDEIESQSMWDALEFDEVLDDGDFSVEAATAYEFSSTGEPEVEEEHHNSPTSLHECVNGTTETSSDTCVKYAGASGLDDASENHSSAPDQCNSRSPNEIQTQANENQQKRPPPLFSANSASSNSEEPESKAEPVSSDAFGHEGELQTGGFRITAEGMVGKPTRTTRKDSDDDDNSRAGPPQSMNKVNVIRSLNEFRKGPTLGVGAAGRVYLAIHEPTGKSVAIKVVNVYDEGKRNQLLKELDTLSTHVSRFLVCFHGAFYDGTGAVHIALEYMDAGCLFSTIQKFGAIPEAVTRMIATDCLRALRFLHRHNVLHRDFKTANILLSRRLLCAKVSDFGLARDLDEGVSRVDTFVGTIAYMSPERLQGKKYTYAADIWALGISVAECLLGCYPFDRPQSYFDYIDASMSRDMLSKMVASRRRVSSKALDFVALCTQTDPSRRPTAAALLEHPWISGVGRDVDLFRAWLDNLAVQKSHDAASMRSMKSIRYFLGRAKKR